jgi:hypothetical protein
MGVMLFCDVFTARKLFPFNNIQYNATFEFYFLEVSFVFSSASLHIHWCMHAVFNNGFNISVYQVFLNLVKYTTLFTNIVQNKYN